MRCHQRARLSKRGSCPRTRRIRSLDEVVRTQSCDDGGHGGEDEKTVVWAHGVSELQTPCAAIELDACLRLLAPDGVLTIVGLGAYPSRSNRNSRSVPGTLDGSMTGGRGELQEIVDFCAQHDIFSQIG